MFYFVKLLRIMKPYWCLNIHVLLEVYQAKWMLKKRVVFTKLPFLCALSMFSSFKLATVKELVILAENQLNNGLVLIRQFSPFSAFFRECRSGKQNQKIFPVSILIGKQTREYPNNLL